ncbi:MAG TPA: tyrosine-type recombinase/integrase [Phenylobacterium sp.]
MPKRTAQHLTVAFCRSVRPSGSSDDGGPARAQSEYPDLEVRGLALRVSSGGQKSWTYRYRDRVTGAQSRMTLGTFDPTSDSEPDEHGVMSLTLHGARVAARQLQAQVDAGLNPALELRRKRESARSQPIKTMADLAEAYFKACENGTHRSGRRRRKAASTLAGERWLWTKHLEARLGSEPPEAVTRSRLRMHLREILETSGGQSNRARGLLSQLFNFAIGEERLTINPVANVPRMAEDAVRTRVLTGEELRTLWRGLQNVEQLVVPRPKGDEKVLISPSVLLAIELAMFTLQRRGEISGMRRSELDLDRNTWVIPAERTKGRSEHLAPLSPRAVSIIKAALELQEGRKKGPSDYVFPSPRSNDEPIEPGALSHAMADLTAALSLKDVRLHDLRRTGATGIAALGTPPFIVSKILAHKDGDGGAAITARHYNLYAYVEEKRAALNSWAQHLEELFGVGPSVNASQRAA